MYVLERHIGRYFALKPGTKKAGMHRGEGFYPRDALAELHTADRYPPAPLIVISVIKVVYLTSGI